MMYVIVNWSGNINYNLKGIYNLTQTKRDRGYDVSIIERDSNRYSWLEKQLGNNVLHAADNKLEKVSG